MGRQIINTFILLLTIAITSAVAQETIYAYQTFYDTRIINGHSIETTNEGSLKFIIGHRFGTLNGGAYELFGLDQSTIRFGLDYGIKNWINIGIGRSSFEKTYDGFLKTRLLYQSSGQKNMPVSVTMLNTIALNSLKWQYPDRANKWDSRLFYTHQLLIARKFNDWFSFQLMPTLAHRNIIPTDTIPIKHDVFSIGTAATFKLWKDHAFNFEYYFNLPNQLEKGYYNSFSIGLDLKTNRHVFQFHLSNSRGMIEKFFVTETRQKWTKGQIQLGFNITRDFQMKGRKYRSNSK